jgi:hypothetical protein
LNLDLVLPVPAQTPPDAEAEWQTALDLKRKGNAVMATRTRARLLQAGVHTSELEEIDGKLGGIAVCA